MDMMTVKAIDLNGDQLNYAVAIAAGKTEPFGRRVKPGYRTSGLYMTNVASLDEIGNHCEPVLTDYIRNWSAMGPLIDAHWRALTEWLAHLHGSAWALSIANSDAGKLVWFARAFVAVRTGLQVSVPVALSNINS